MASSRASHSPFSRAANSSGSGETVDGVLYEHLSADRKREMDELRAMAFHRLVGDFSLVGLAYFVCGRWGCPVARFTSL